MDQFPGLETDIMVERNFMANVEWVTTTGVPKKIPKIKVFHKKSRSVIALKSYSLNALECLDLIS